MFKILLSTLTFLALTGCAAIQLPAEQLESSESSVRAAEELGAQSVPSARLQLQLAHDQTVTAKKMAADGDERAPLVLARAQADAELALGLAREASVHQAALKAADELKAVKERPNP
jgi:hypothetical protein